MISVKVEVWLWMEKELGGDFRPISDMRSRLEINVEEGATIRELFDKLADRYRAIDEKIFDRKKRLFSGGVAVTLNDRVISPRDMYDKTLKTCDKITVLPAYAGG